MLRVNNLLGFGAGAGGVPPEFIEALIARSLDTNLKICLDLGDTACYGGSGQTITDLSAGAEDVWFGADGTSEGTDPTFNGVAGDLSSAEYLSTDGGDKLTFKAKPTWIDPFHKNNATWSYLAALYHPGDTATNAFFSNGPGNLSTPGVRIEVRTAEEIRILVTHASGGLSALTATSSASITVADWSIFGASIDEAAGAGNSFHHINGAEETFDGTYNSPTTSAASITPKIMTNGTESTFLTSGSRLALFAMWDAALSVEDFDNIWSDMRGRFSL